MVNFGFNLITLLGLIDILSALACFILLAGTGLNSYASSIKNNLSVWELVVFPLLLFPSGIILFFNGWRLDPFLQIQQLLIHAAVGVTIAKEIDRL